MPRGGNFRFFEPIERSREGQVLVSLLLMLLVVSFSIHVVFLAIYIQKRRPRYLTLFVNTTVVNVIIAGLIMGITIYRPEEARKIDAKVLTWFIAGVILVLTVAIQAFVFRRIYRRCKMPENYHLNYFGKKVLHHTVVRQGDIVLFFATMPFLLIVGAYFVARLINIILYGHL